MSTAVEKIAAQKEVFENRNTAVRHLIGPNELRYLLDSERDCRAHAKTLQLLCGIVLGKHAHDQSDHALVAAVQKLVEKPKPTGKRYKLVDELVAELPPKIQAEYRKLKNI